MSYMETVRVVVEVAVDRKVAGWLSGVGHPFPLPKNEVGGYVRGALTDCTVGEVLWSTFGARVKSVAPAEPRSEAGPDSGATLG